MKSVLELHQQLEAAGCGDSQELRIHGAGDTGHQGDVYVHPIKTRPAAWAIETTDESRQVAVGQGEGSNHKAQGDVRVFWPESTPKAIASLPLRGLFNGDEACLAQTIGPVIEAKEPWTLTHPKHAHHQFPAGTYLVTFQLDRRTMRRVQD